MRPRRECIVSQEPAYHSLGIGQIIATGRMKCALCGHERQRHAKEADLHDYGSQRELCVICPGYECPGYPKGKAWHRFRERKETQ